MYRASCEKSREVLAAASLDDVSELPRRRADYNVRWILCHMLEETARHAGHADIVREAIDGATMYELMAGAEGWPETEWLKPWRRSVIDVLTG